MTFEIISKVILNDIKKLFEFCCDVIFIQIFAAKI